MSDTEIGRGLPRELWQDRHFEADKSMYGDPLIETPMQFVAIEAHPNRSPEDEPEGSGPFGF